MSQLSSYQITEEYINTLIICSVIELFLHAKNYVTLLRRETHLVLRVHFGHHAIFQKVKGQHLQHIKLVGHLIINGFGAPDYSLEHRQGESTEIKI